MEVIKVALKKPEWLGGGWEGQIANLKGAKTNCDCWSKISAQRFQKFCFDILKKYFNFFFNYVRFETKKLNNPKWKHFVSTQNEFFHWAKPRNQLFSPRECEANPWAKDIAEVHVFSWLTLTLPFLP